MKVNFNDILYALSYGLDCVEYNLVGATANHAKRVAYISTVLGKAMGIKGDALLDLAACAILHDCALTEYFQAEGSKERLLKARNEELRFHCVSGEKNVKELPFSTDVCGAVLYHHENADGTGAFGKTTKETPLFAQLIHFADILDVECDLEVFSMEKYSQVKSYLDQRRGTIFEEEHIERFLKALPPEALSQLQGEGVDFLLARDLPQRTIDHGEEALHAVAVLFAQIIDYNSSFTSRHSLGMADKSIRMAQYYGYDHELQEKLYFAGALHDVGKLVVSRDVLEKAGRLDAEEYTHIQTHVWYTYQILSGIKGIEDITRWASRHHEKLDGSGYPQGLKAEELDHNDRLMACLDIYQALTEPRAYKDGMPHEEVMGILRGMVDKGQLDGEIVEDIHQVYGGAGAGCLE